MRSVLEFFTRKKKVVLKIKTQKCKNAKNQFSSSCVLCVIGVPHLGVIYLCTKYREEINVQKR